MTLYQEADVAFEEVIVGVGHDAAFAENVTARQLAKIFRKILTDLGKML
jgi:hypothetical protein